MYEQCKATLQMTRVFLQNGSWNDKVCQCEVLTYKPDEECIYLLAGEEELSLFSLDGLYDCRIITEDEEVKCSGVIRERYYNRQGKMLIMQIQNGFYKNPLN